jgi:hypothetical protein
MVEERYPLTIRLELSKVKHYLAWHYKDGYTTVWGYSVEQLWLAFVMKEKYSKQWLQSEREWVKMNP